MKMWHKPLAVCYELNDIVGEQVRFYRRYSESFNTIYFIQFLYQFKERLFSYSFVMSGLQAKIAKGLHRSIPLL